MRMIYEDISTSRWGCLPMEPEMSVLVPCLIRSSGPGGEPVLRLGVPMAMTILSPQPGRRTGRPDTSRLQQRLCPLLQSASVRDSPRPDRRGW
jgi:hypothetical protein